jgi:hypothetical protein
MLLFWHCPKKVTKKSLDKTKLLPTRPAPARRFVRPTLQERRTRTKQDSGGISHCIRNDRNFLQREGEKEGGCAALFFLYYQLTCHLERSERSRTLTLGGCKLHQPISCPSRKRTGLVKITIVFNREGPGGGYLQAIRKLPHPCPSPFWRGGWGVRKNHRPQGTQANKPPNVTFCHCPKKVTKKSLDNPPAGGPRTGPTPALRQ